MAGYAASSVTVSGPTGPRHEEGKSTDADCPALPKSSGAETPLQVQLPPRARARPPAARFPPLAMAPAVVISLSHCAVSSSSSLRSPGPSSSSLLSSSSSSSSSSAMRARVSTVYLNRLSPLCPLLLDCFCAVTVHCAVCTRLAPSDSEFRSPIGHRRLRESCGASVRFTPPYE